MRCELARDWEPGRSSRCERLQTDESKLLTLQWPRLRRNYPKGDDAPESLAPMVDAVAETCVEESNWRRKKLLRTSVDVVQVQNKMT